MAERVVQSGVGNSKYWTGIVSGDTAEPMKMDRGILAGTVHVEDEGSWNNVAITIQGSFDGTNWFTVKDVDGNALDIIDEGVYNFVGLFPYVRPSPGAITGTVGVYIMVRA